MDRAPPLNRTPLQLVPYNSGRQDVPLRVLMDFQSIGLGAVSLGSVLRDEFQGLDPAILNQAVQLEGLLESARPTLYVHFLGYDEAHTPQIWVKHPITKAAVTMHKLLFTVAREIDKAIKRARRQVCTDPRLALLPGGLSIDNLLLTGLIQVGKARMQPVLEIVY